MDVDMWRQKMLVGRSWRIRRTARARGLLNGLAPRGLIFAALAMVCHALPAMAYEVWVTNQRDDIVHIIDPRTRQEVGRIPTGRNPITLAFSPDCARAFVSNWRSSNVTVIDAVERRVLASLELGGEPHGADLRPGSKQIFVSDSGRGRLLVVDTTTMRVERIVPVGGAPLAVTFTPDGRIGYVPRLSGGVVVIDAQAGRAIGHIQGVGQAFAVALTGENARGFVALGFADAVGMMALRRRVMTTRLAGGPDRHFLRLSPDRQAVWIVDRIGNKIVLVAGADGHEMGVVADVGERPDVIAFAPDGQTAFVSLHGKVPDGYPPILSGVRPGVAIIDVKTLRVLDRIDLTGDPHGIAIRE